MKIVSRYVPLLKSLKASSRFLAFCFLIFLLSFNSSCGRLWSSITYSSKNPSTPTVYNYYAYVANQNATEPLDGFSMNPVTGELKTLTVAMPADINNFNFSVTSYTLTTGQVMVMDWMPNGVYGYIVNSATGALNEVANSPAHNMNFGPYPSLTLNPLYPYFYGFNGGALLNSYGFNTTTGAFASSPQTVASGNYAHSFLVDVSGNYLYVADQSGGDVKSYQVTPGTGALSLVATYATTVLTGFGTVQLIADPQGRFLFEYIQMGASPDLIYSFKINGDGTLAPNGSVNGTNEQGAGGVCGLVIDNTGHYLYQGTPFGPLTKIYSITQTNGVLVPFGTLADGGAMIVDPTNTYLLINGVGNSINSYTGVSTGTPVATGFSGPDDGSNLMYFDPNYQFIYSLASGGDSNVWGFKFNYANGSFTAIPNSPFSTGITPMSVSFAKTPR